MRWWLLTAFCIAGVVAIGFIAHTTDVETEDNVRTCAAICGSASVEVISPKYNRSKMCLCPIGPRGEHWTLAYLDGGTP